VASSTRRPVRLYTAIAESLLALGALGWLVMGWLASPAQGYVPSPPYLNCYNDSQGVLGGLEASLAPANGASVQAGAPVTFSGNASTPVTFAVASSPALLSNPDIDGGPGSAVPISSGPSPTYTYMFTSTKATATPGTVYWDASFSSANLVECAGQPPNIYTTPARALTVLPAPVSPPPTPPTPPPPAEPPPLQVGIGVTGSFHLAHPAVTYRISCTASCSGETYYQALVVRRHRKAVLAPKLDLGREPVSVTTAAGGDEQFTYVYSGSLLRMLRTIARTGGVLELRIAVKVTGASGDVAQAQHTAQLRT
jgi:hypothetical protein